MQQINLSSQDDIYIDQLTIHNYSQEDRYCTYKRITEARSCNTYCCGTAICVTYSECVSVALVIQGAKCTRPIILPSVGCLAVLYSSTLFHKTTQFPEVIDHKIVFRISVELLSEIFVILRRTELGFIINVQGSLCIVPFIFVVIKFEVF
jgi:hypothetical protein